MVDMASVSTSIAWGVPVRPDLLGQSLEAYESFLPTLTALRLCHRYGSGPQAHITKLPAEILSAVEDIIFQDLLAKYTSWIERFRHFESRCAPSDHFEADINADLWTEVESEILDKLCESCVSTGADEDCPKGCYSIVDDMVEEALVENGDYRFNQCEEARGQWEKQIDQRPEGLFKKFDQLLLKHFGLEAYFAATRVTDETPRAWPNDPNHGWEFMDVLQTTTCYITLPRRQARRTSYAISEYEADSGYAIVQGAQSSLVQIPSHEMSSRRVKQFSHVLRSLRLKPYMHESQLLDDLAADEEQRVSVGEPCEKTAETSETNPGKTDDRGKIRWPQLVVLVKTQFNW